jgi:hypothetical protein
VKNGRGANQASAGAEGEEASGRDAEQRVGRDWQGVEGVERQAVLACQFLCEPGRREFSAADRILAGPRGRESATAMS